MLAVLAGTFLTGGCAQPPPGAPPAGSPTSPTTVPPSPPSDGGLVLMVSYTGGFATPQTSIGRLPLVAVYADGRVITEGPVPAVHPGPALPNLQERELPAGEVADLVGRALAAGVGEKVDYGTPPVADAPSTRFTLVTADGVEVTEVYALSEASYPGGGSLPGLTEEQLAARARLLDLLDALTATGTAATVAYEPDAVAAIVGPWSDPGDGLPAPEPVAWLGPPLPGGPVGTLPGVTCVSARAEAADAVLDAAAPATSATPWTSDDGTRWSVVFRPLLPHETGCADLVG